MGVTHQLKHGERQVVCRGVQLVRSLVRSFTRSFPCSLVRSFVRSLVRLFARSLVRSFARSLIRSLVRSLPRSFACSLVCSLARSLVRSFTRSLVRCSLVRSFVRSLVRSFARSFAPPFVRSFVQLGRSFALSAPMSGLGACTKEQRRAICALTPNEQPNRGNEWHDSSATSHWFPRFVLGFADPRKDARGRRHRVPVVNHGAATSAARGSRPKTSGTISGSHDKSTFTTIHGRVPIPRRS